MYKGLEEDVTVFGVGATFVSSTNTDDAVVYQVVKAVFENFDRFRRLPPAFANLKKEDMITKNISAPLHDRSEERRVGTACVSTCRSRCTTNHTNKKNTQRERK